MRRKVNGRVRTFWKALSGQVARKLSSGLEAAARRVKDSVGAGSHTNMKSAMMAITTLAPTKSISCLRM